MHQTLLFSVLLNITKTYHPFFKSESSYSLFLFFLLSCFANSFLSFLKEFKE